MHKNARSIFCGKRRIGRKQYWVKKLGSNMHSDLIGGCCVSGEKLLAPARACSLLPEVSI